MYACGLRISEASTLEVPAIDGKQGLVRIIGKGNKERLVPLPMPMLDQLRQIWKLHHHPRWIFPNKDNTNHVNTAVLYQSFKDARAQSGVDPAVSPHTLRHSYATRLMDSGVDIGIVQLLLGHASIKSTVVYIHLSEVNRRHIREFLDDFMVGL
jgi:integrase/recombinase XerD